MNLNRVFEIFGVNGNAAVRVHERPEGGKCPISIRSFGNAGESYLSISEARYLADRLTYLADKIVKKRKACSDGCADDDE